MNSGFYYQKLSWPILLVAMMLQRSPVLRVIVHSEFSLVPRVQHMWKAVVAAVTVGAYHSVSAASGQIEIAPGSTDTTVGMGEELRVVLWVAGERPTEQHPPELWEISGALPTGIQTTENRNTGTLSFTGIPTEVGQFPITVTAWEHSNKREGSSDTFDLTLIVEGSGPVFTQQPPSQTIPWGGDLTLSAALDVAEGTTYQWQRISSGEVEYSDIEGATGSTLSIVQIKGSDEGMYRLVASNGGSTVQSEAAMVSVSATAFQVWREAHFQNPFANDSEEGSDPDSDMLSNLLEFAFGRDPQVAESAPLVSCSMEAFNNELYVVYSYPPISEGAGHALSFQTNSSLDPLGWVILQPGMEGVVIEKTAQAYRIKIKASDPRFMRLRVSTD